MTRSAERHATADRPWLELAVVADHEAVEAVSEILSRFAGGGVAIEPGYELVREGLEARIDPHRPAVVRAYLPDTGDEAARAIDAVREALGHLQAFDLRPIGQLEVRTLREADWATAWKRHFPVLRVGTRLVIRPSWRRYRPREGDVVLALDPGAAFGTGLHPTTRLCLEAVERWADDGRLAGARVLDVGCGSGILGLAAVRLGATSVLGIDTDPLAIEASQANARRNRVLRRVAARLGPLPTAAPAFDLVLANLIASLLVELAPALAAELRPGCGPSDPGGRLVAGGIFVDREEDVRRAFAAAGLRVVDCWREGEWVAIEAERVD